MRQRVLVGTALVMVMFMPSAFATLTDGVYTGTASGQYTTSACSGGGSTNALNVPFNGATATLTIQNSVTDFALTFSDSDFSLQGTDGILDPVNLHIHFESSFGGNLNINAQNTGDSTTPFDTDTAISQSGNTVTLGAETISGATAFCNVTFMWNSFTLSLVVAGQQVDPKITPSTTITIPLILKTEIQVIVSDLQYRIKDVLRAWQLRRKQFWSGRRDRERDRRDREREDQDSSLSPTGDDGEVVADTREQEDRLTPVRIQRTGSGLMMNSLSGMNAGDSNYLYGAWGSYSYTDFENDFASTAFDGSRHGGLVGLDVSPWEGVLLGLAVGYEDTDIDTDFNLGNQETDGFTIAPYLGALINDTWSVNASFGYSSLETDQFRTLGTTTFTSSPDSDRWFAMFNLNGLTTYDNWIIGGQIGILYARNELDAYIETSSLGATTLVAEMDTKLAQWNIGADVAYSYGEFEPFARVMYENDFSQTEIGVIGGPQPSFDDDDVMLGFGMRYFGANNLTGNLEFNTRLGRDDYDEYDISATIRYDW